MPTAIDLPGLIAANPLAFLAALGTLRAAQAAGPAALSWKRSSAGWHAVLHILPGVGDLAQFLADTLESNPLNHPASFLNRAAASADDSADRTGALLASACTTSQPYDRARADYMAALLCDIVPDATSQLQTARRDYFWGNVEAIIRRTTAGHLERTLFHSWDYADGLDNQSLHLEPSEDRRHGYQWHAPSDDPARAQAGGMLGANRLAIEAYPFFLSVAASRDKLATRGFTGIRASDARWTWPVWSEPLPPDATSSLLGLSELQEESPDPGILSARGIKAAFRCRRILVGKTPNLTPAVRIV